GHRRGARLAAFRANGGQQQEGRVGKIAAHLALVGPKLIDRVLVKIVVLAHVPLLYTLLLISRQTFEVKNGNASLQERLETICCNRRRRKACSISVIPCSIRASTSC